MKQIELAQRLGISKSYLSMILSGQRIPNPELARRLSSLEVHKFEAKSSLARRRSTTELLPLCQARGRAILLNFNASCLKRAIW